MSDDALRSIAKLKGWERPLRIRHSEPGGNGIRPWSRKAADFGEDVGFGEDVLVLGCHIHALGRDGEYLIQNYVVWYRWRASGWYSRPRCAQLVWQKR